jgi:hypothetical protein
MTRPFSILRRSRLSLIGLATLVAVLPAHADLKLVSKMHVDIGGTTRPDQEFTTYYKGNLIRSESGDTVTLSQVQTGLTAVLRPSTKTYRQFNVNQSAPGNPAMRAMKVEGQATVTPTAEHKVIAGKNATKFVADVDVTMTSSSNQAFSQHTTMHIVRWTTTEVSTGISPDLLARFSPESMTFQGLSGMDEVNKELAKITGVPLSSEVTIKSEFSGPSGVGGIPPPSIEEIDTDVQSIDDSALDDSLFQVPPDYKKTVSPGHLPGPGVGA